MLNFFAILISLSALFGYINHRWLKLPTTIGVMLISVVLGITLKSIESFNSDYISPLRNFLTGFDFSAFVLDFILCFLLFAGALHVNIGQLKGARATVFSYSTLGVIISTLIIGSLTKVVIGWFGFNLGLPTCFLFGALISPTDPIAVIGILSKYKIPQKLKTEIIGESLFNDGVGVVVFAVIYSIITGGAEAFTFNKVFEIFAVEVFGGIGIGLLIGYVGYLLMKSIDHYQTEILITLAVVTGGYSIASQFHASGPLAMVVAGLFIGNKGKSHAMSDTTAEYVDKFWELIDEICNTILFVLMGLEIFLVPFDYIYLIIGLILIGVALFARYVSLLPAFFIFNRREKRKSLNLAVLTWGGLRGGISIALALSLVNKIEGSSLFIVSTYCIVLFSILVQGLSIKKLLGKY
ncbi:MAG: sodium:proton antiporter [Bacteroidia bacterium]|nr:sodium:proton antiporter [Bacteroidia bacterium]MDO9001153.1 sodium:proton antiporter [Bacteroidota bacterium]MDP3145596.1 sodium:proton antiporter [Bacteroidota bacterium]